MPSLGADMEEGTVTEWRVAPGDTVRRGDIVAVVDTDKADIDVEIFEDGVVEAILVPEGERVPVGTPLAVIGAHGQAAAEPAPAPRVGGAAAPSPVLRRLARHLGVDLATVRGTGPGGAITRHDVETAARGGAEAVGAVPAVPAVPTGPAPAERDAAMRQAIARLMARSKREIPHYYLGTDVDFSRSRAWLDETNARRAVGERLLPAALQLRAVALAALEVPEVNGHWVDDGFVPSARVHVGFAVALRGGGLIAPALLDAHEKSLDEVMRDLRDLVARTRGGHLRASEMSGATITVTNLGDQGVRTVHGVIYPPQVALVGFGRVEGRPWAESGMLGVRPIVSVSLAADHRASDGARGARFLNRVDDLLQHPEAL